LQNRIRQYKDGRNTCGLLSDFNLNVCPLFQVLYGQLGQRRDGHEDGHDRDERATPVSATVFLSDGKSVGDDVTISQRQHVLASKRRL